MNSVKIIMKGFNRVSPLYPFPTNQAAPPSDEEVSFNRVSPLYPFPTPKNNLGIPHRKKSFNRVSPLYPFPTLDTPEDGEELHGKFQSGFSPLSFSNIPHFFLNRFGKFNPQNR